MTHREIMARVAGLVATLLPLAPGQVMAQSDVRPMGIPPDSVAAVFVTDPVPGFGALGGMASGPAPDHPHPEARLESGAPPS